MKITVYERTSSYCGQCVATKRSLDNKGVEYTSKAIEGQSEEWLQGHKDAGRMMAPIVVVDYPSGGSVEWSGFRPDFIENLEVK
ncbi:MAG: glutaredoxin family protein [Brevibacterium sp.]|uniref:glutaredoxin family protein n=1 Tax=Brevibacterium aurantiacum TaxID=273384 RepID=UPI003F936923